MRAGTVAELWRYPVKSMGGEQVASSAVDDRALHGDRTWAVRDLRLDAITTARRLPDLLRCTARYVAEPPSGVGPGDVADVEVTFPDGTQAATDDRARLDARLTELVGTPVALVPLPPRDDKAAYRGVAASQRDLRQQFGLADDEPLPDLSVFPLAKLAELTRYATPVGLFADAYPLHVVTTSSLRVVAEHGGDADVRRFRPNVVVDGAPDGLAEQAWLGGALTAGGLGARVEIPTIRCTVPLREQAGVPADPEAVRAVARAADRCLGVYADITAPGSVRVGDPVEVDPPRDRGAAAASLGRLAERARRRAVRAGQRALPR
ncbi:MOSC domain-containing protein [Nocardioides litoris]|uniref:MOSC domain-containing protein n=1 Tax=Nocardioides litoris TaxID=1926648 RepID=UPI0011244774|nr:MOSC N-terminal beta barrel domain-containing protein [Nocardioides litoris]